jgi:hypothetical protein
MEYQMPNPTRLEVNCATNEVLEIELTDTEIAQLEKDRVAYEALEAEKVAAEENSARVKASALAKLAELGLTEDEAKAIAG